LEIDIADGLSVVAAGRIGVVVADQTIQVIPRARLRAGRDLKMVIQSGRVIVIDRSTTMCQMIDKCMDLPNRLPVPSESPCLEDQIIP
jgi:hypothetical protein